MAATPHIKRYALVPNDSNKGMRRFHLARVASAGRVPDAERLERMEDVAAEERRRGKAPYESQPGVD